MERLRPLLLWLCIALLCGGWPVSRAASLPKLPSATLPQGAAVRPVIQIIPGSEHRSELTRQQVDQFEFTLAAHEFLNVVLDSREVSGVFHSQMAGPNGQVLAESQYFSASGQQQIAVIAPQAGRYRLTIKLPEDAKDLGVYRLRILAQRPAQPGDEARLHWQRTLTRIEQLPRKTKLENWQPINAEMAALRSGGLEATSTIETAHLQAALLFDAKQKTEAAAVAQQALQLAQQTGNQYLAAALLNQLGLLAHIPATLPQALDYYQQALQAARAANNQVALGFAAMNSGAIHSQRGEVPQAIELFQQAYTAWKAQRDESGSTLALSNLGAAHLQIGELQLSLDYHLRSVSEASPDQRRWRSEAEIGTAYAYYVIGDFDAARTYYQRALDDAPNPRAHGPMLAGLGACAMRLGDTASALTYYTQALERLRSAGDQFNEALTLGALGLLHEAQNQPETALQYLQEALALARRTLNRNQQALGLVKLGAVYSALQQPEQAREHFTQALTLSQQISDRQVEAEARLGLARLARNKRDWPTARQQSEAALQLIETGRRKIASHAVRSAYFASVNQHYEFYIDLLQEMQRREPARDFAALAFQTSERARARGLVEMLAEARVDLRESVAPDLLARERQLQQALNAANEVQFQVLSRFHFKAEAETLQQRITALTIELNEVQARIRAASPRYAALTAPAPLSAAEVQAQLDANTVLLEYALGEHRSYLWAVTKDSLASYELPPRAELEAQALRVRELLTARQPRPGESAPQRAQRLAAADARYQSEAAKLSHLLLAPAAPQLTKSRLAIVADGALQYVPFAALPECGVRIGACGLPTEDAPTKAATESNATVQRSNNVAFPKPLARNPQSHVPQSAIRNPQSKLTSTNGNSQPLIAKYEIVHLPSAAVLASLRREAGKHAPATKTLAVFADPVFEADDPRLQRKPLAPSTLAQALPAASATGLRRTSDDLKAASGASVFGRLLSSRREAKRLLSFVPQPDQRWAALDFAAERRAAFDEQLAQYRFIHFATHGVLNEVHPELSGIVLSLRDEAGAAQDGFLRLHEIYQLKLNAELVTLSACQTGLGKELRGEGLIGLTRGFMYAGAARVTASLWKVQDDATAELMHEFYRALLQQGQRPAAALRTAQLALLAKPAWRQPFYWAAFILQGDWR